MFFSGLSRLISMKPFPNLLKLVIVNQTLERIEGLETCVNLQELWITECKLKVCTYLAFTSVSCCMSLRVFYQLEVLIEERKNLFVIYSFLDISK